MYCRCWTDSQVQWTQLQLSAIPRNSTQNHPKHTIPNVKHGVGSIMLQGCFAGKGSGQLQKIDEENLREEDSLEKGQDISTEVKSSK